MSEVASRSNGTEVVVEVVRIDLWYSKLHHWTVRSQSEFGGVDDQRSRSSTRMTVCGSGGFFLAGTHEVKSRNLPCGKIYEIRIRCYANDETLAM